VTCVASRRSVTAPLSLAPTPGALTADGGSTGTRATCDEPVSSFVTLVAMRPIEARKALNSAIFARRC
jgi:hypothetical protein